MNLLELSDDIHYLINQEIKKTEHFNLRVHKDKFKKVLIDIETFNYNLEDTDLDQLIETPIFFTQRRGWVVD